MAGDLNKLDRDDLVLFVSSSESVCSLCDRCADKKLCSESSNETLADDTTPVSNCMDGTSGSISEPDVSNDILSLFHHGDPPSEAVR